MARQGIVSGGVFICETANRSAIVSGGIYVVETSPLVGKRLRGRRRIKWTDQYGEEQQIVSPPPLLNVEAEQAAWAAISARLNRIETLRTELQAATERTAHIRQLERELAILQADEDDEDDIETLLLS